MRRCIILSLLIFIAAPALFAGLTPRWAHPKPSHTVLYPGDSRTDINFKCVEGSGVRLRSGALVSENGTDLTELYAVLGDYRMTGPDRLFTRPENILDAEKATGEERTGEQLPDLNLWYMLQLEPGQPTVEFIDRLNALDVIEIAFAVSESKVAGDIDPPTPDYVDRQGYLLAAPGGIDVAAVREFEGGYGEDIRIIDLEFGWTWDHEDLKEPFWAQNKAGVPADGIAHGTAVLGEMVGGHNGYGVDGICPNAEVGGNSAYQRDQQMAAVVNEIAAQLRVGDFYLFELQRGFGGKWSPLETFDDIFDAVKVASANGKILIEAAGNGNSNLDDPLYGGRFNPALRHSGAIMVGAGAPPGGAYGPDRCRLDFSNYGQRVDVQGWGRLVMTTGVVPDDTLFFPNRDVRQGYTSKFSGTSSATPIVVGAVACLQGIYKKKFPGKTLDADVLRNILVKTGSPQQNGQYAGNIGPRPNLKEAVKIQPLMNLSVIGSVVAASNSAPVRGAKITVKFEGGIHSDRTYTTDENGEFTNDRFPADTKFSVTASAAGYNDSTVTDQIGEPDGMIFVEIALLKGALSLSENKIEATLEPNQQVGRDFSIVNDGNGSISWERAVVLEEDISHRSWALDSSITFALNLPAEKYGGIVYANGYYFIPGAYYSMPNCVYRLDRNFAFVDSFNQWGGSRYGLAGLAYDGDLIWGGDENQLYGYSTSGEKKAQFQVAVRPAENITWDSENQLLWLSSKNSATIYSYQSDGTAGRTLPNPGFTIYSFAYMESDPDGYKLYILHTDTEQMLAVHKMNLQTGDTLFVAYPEIHPEGGEPLGGYITNMLDPNGNHQFMTVVTNNAPNSYDRINIYRQLVSPKHWLVVEGPTSGQLKPGDNADFELTINSRELTPGTYRANFEFTTSASEGKMYLPVELKVTPLDVKAEPTPVVPTTIQLTSIYPNPFNSTTTITFALPPTSDRVNLSLFDINGRQLAELFDGRKSAGQYSVQFNAQSLPAGVYLVKLQVGGAEVVRKMTLLK